VVVCLLNEITGKRFDDKTAQEWQKVCQTAENYGAVTCTTLDEVVSVLKDRVAGKEIEKLTTGQTAETNGASKSPGPAKEQDGKGL
jgi:hypothetical protein